jgi:hypothetical protein
LAPIQAKTSMAEVRTRKVSTGDLNLGGNTSSDDPSSTSVTSTQHHHHEHPHPQDSHSHSENSHQTTSHAHFHDHHSNPTVIRTRSTPTNSVSHISPIPPTVPISMSDTSDVDVSEAQDVFLPLESSTPYTFNFPEGPTPTTAGFTPVNSSSGSSRMDHRRNHSRIHERNLSVFFPQPGVNPPLSGGYEDTGFKNEIPQPSQGVVGAFKFGSGSGGTPRSGVISGGEKTANSQSTDTNSRGRRGHHHRHSLSHNFFHDPYSSVPNSALPSPMTGNTSSSINPAVPKSVPISRGSSLSTTPSLVTQISTISRAKYSHLPTFLAWSLAFTFHSSTSDKIKFSLFFSSLILGSALWIRGQSGESLSVTGLGYLIVFDSISALFTLLTERELTQSMGQSLRNSYGNARIGVAWNFAQSVYLIFSSVYVLKEAVEHVLLMHGPMDEDSHGAGHGGMGHGEIMSFVKEKDLKVESSIFSEDGVLNEEMKKLRGGFGDEGLLNLPIGIEEEGLKLPGGMIALAGILAIVAVILVRNHEGLTRGK